MQKNVINLCIPIVSRIFFTCSPWWNGIDWLTITQPSVAGSNVGMAEENVEKTPSFPVLNHSFLVESLFGRTQLLKLIRFRILLVKTSPNDRSSTPSFGADVSSNARAHCKIWPPMPSPFAKNLPGSYLAPNGPTLVDLVDRHGPAWKYLAMNSDVCLPRWQNPERSGNHKNCGVYFNIIWTLCNQKWVFHPKTWDPMYLGTNIFGFTSSASQTQGNWTDQKLMEKQWWKPWIFTWSPLSDIHPRFVQSSHLVLHLHFKSAVKSSKILWEKL